MIQNDLVFGVVLGRGGSKGLPGKNVRYLGGFPLIAWSVAAGITAGINRVVCSTDDADIAAAAVRAGADAPFVRPAHYAHDTATDLDVFGHLVSWLAEYEQCLPEFLVQLRPTTPFRNPEWIMRGLDIIRADESITAVRSVTQSPITPYKMWCRDGSDGELKPLLELEGYVEPYNMPRAELPEVLWHTGQLDIIRTTTILSGSMTGSKIRGLDVPPDLAIDIDTLIDFQLAELRLSGYMPDSLTRYLRGRWADASSEN